MSFLLAERTYVEAQALCARGALVLLPIGATEAHGPHLPLATDCLLSEGLALRVAQALAASGRAACIAPTLPFAVTECAAAFAGTVSLSPATAQALYSEACAGLLRAGFPRVCLLSNHLEPEHVQVLRATVAARAAAGQPVAFPDFTERRHARLLTPEYKRGTCHAGRYESSLVLATRPALVNEELRQGLAVNEPDFLGALRAGVRDFRAAGGPRAYFGDPAAASAAEGEEIYQILTTITLQVLTETYGDP